MLVLRTGVLSALVKMPFSYSKRMKAKVNFSNHRELIRALGGIKTVAVALQEPYPTVASWCLKDIPVAAWEALIAFASEQNVHLSSAELLATRRGRRVLWRGERVTLCEQAQA